MPSNNFSVGRDTTVIVQHAFVGRVELKHVIGFHPKQETVAAAVSRLDGKHLTAHLPKGWSGTIEIEKGNAALDQFIGALETAYYNGVNVPTGQVYQYDTEVDGSRTTYQFQDCSFHMPEAGQRKNDATVKQSLAFNASRRVVV